MLVLLNIEWKKCLIKKGDNILMKSKNLRPDAATGKPAMNKLRCGYIYEVTHIEGEGLRIFFDC